MHVKYTAIKRKTPSSPIKYLIDNVFEDWYRKTILDYGCGRGFDADFLNFDKYDKYWFPIDINKKYDYIICSFVLNVVTKSEQYKILKHIKSLLNKNGKAFITVRRDLKQDVKYDTYTQRLVYLRLKSIHKNSNYEIYEMERL